MCIRDSETVIAQSQVWYARHFGAKPGVRNDAPVADLPGVQLRFAKTDKPMVPTRGRILDHIGFDVKDLKAFLATLEADGIKADVINARFAKPIDQKLIALAQSGQTIVTIEDHSITCGFGSALLEATASIQNSKSKIQNSSGSRRARFTRM